MRFRQYSDNSATLKEWSKQLTIANKGIYRLYPTVEDTLKHWKDELNKNIGTNTFSLNGSSEATLYNWQEKLNGLYNI